MVLLDFHFRYRVPSVPTTLERGSLLLQETEAKLRGLVSEAASSGDYASVVQIASWARTVSELLDRGVPARAGAAEANVKILQKRSNRDKKAVSISKRERRTYPQFFRQDDQIVRGPRVGKRSIGTRLLTPFSNCSPKR
jgi:hypothetical protein